MKVSSSVIFPILSLVTPSTVSARSLRAANRSPMPTASPTSFVGEYSGGQSSPHFLTAASQNDSDACPTEYDGMVCSSDGSTNYHAWSDVTYDSDTGYFKATLVTNQCNAFTAFEANSRISTCVEQSIPDDNFSEKYTPYQMPLLSTAAWSLNGVNMYSPYENGFSDGQLCDGASAHGGMDLVVVDDFMTQHCPSHVKKDTLLLDTCGGHADPYHYHQDLVCAYDHTVTTHSPLIAIALTGQGVYGKFESDLTVPTDLDECNGHWGPVPGSDEMGTEGSDYVYHYHTTDTFPFTIGCYGPLQDTTCTELNDEACSQWDPVELDIMVDGFTETIEYRYWCPCRSDNEDAYSLSDSSESLSQTRKERARRMREQRRLARI